MEKDKRIKGCANESCDSFLAKRKFSSSDSYCSACGMGLVFVCSKCHGPIEDEGPKHRLCRSCEAKAKDQKQKRNDAMKKAVAPVAAGAGAVAYCVKNKLPAILELRNRR